jgi:hypothetical protein
MLKSLYGVYCISLTSVIAEPVLGINKTTAEFIAAILFFLIARIFDKWKNDKKIEYLKSKHENEISTIKEFNNENR